MKTETTSTRRFFNSSFFSGFFLGALLLGIIMSQMQKLNFQREGQEGVATKSEMDFVRKNSKRLKMGWTKCTLFESNNGYPILLDKSGHQYFVSKSSLHKEFPKFSKSFYKQYKSFAERMIVVSTIVGQDEFRKQFATHYSRISCKYKDGE